jgi:hypothetical protein
LVGQGLFAWSLLRMVLKATAEDRSTFCRWCCDEVPSGGKVKARA